MKAVTDMRLETSKIDGLPTAGAEAATSTEWMGLSSPEPLEHGDAHRSRDAVQ